MHVLNLRIVGAFMTIEEIKDKERELLVQLQLALVEPQLFACSLIKLGTENQLVF